MARQKKWKLSHHDYYDDDVLEGAKYFDTKEDALFELECKTGYHIGKVVE